MDTGLGSFAPLSEEKAGELIGKDIRGVFTTDETLEIRGSLFKIQKIEEKKMVLRLLRKPQ